MIGQDKKSDERIKLYRVYFNSKADAPNYWSVDAGTIASEIIVASIELVGAHLVSRLNLSADNVHDPKAWFEVSGILSLNGNRAVIAGEDDTSGSQNISFASDGQ